MIHLILGAALACLAIAAPGILYLFHTNEPKNAWVEWAVAADVYLPGITFLCVCVVAGLRCALWGFW